MSFRKIRYHTGEEIFKVEIEDQYGGRLDKWTFMKHDFPQWVSIISRKFGIKMDKKDKDLDWAIS